MQLDAAWYARLTADQAGLFSPDHHLVHGRSADLDEPLHVALGRWPITRV